MRLVLLRHAEAEVFGASDAERVLTARGRVDAAAVGRWLAAEGVVPDLAVVSPAARARETWTLVAAGLPAAPPCEVDLRVYANDVDTLLAVVEEADPAVGTLAVVGHNPSVSDLAHALGSDADGFRPAAVAVFELGAAARQVLFRAP